ncbi:MAG TPA: PCYCGC motif-containing (lipo)protein [Vicinamibacterales bacterium]
MGRKSSAKAKSPAGAPPPDQPRAKSPVVVATLVVIALAVGVFTYLNNATRSEAEQTSAALQIPDRGPTPTDLKPHPQENLPPLQFPGYPMARSPEVVRAAYKFAAEHPEVMSYVPCFCGCERMGHRGNEDCFVKARDVNGDVVQWEDHGMECAVCLDVATRSLQLYTSGASVTDIRAAIEKEFTPLSTNHTPTPDAPHTH